MMTLALLRLLKIHQAKIAGAKIGPDYIDPAFHALASGRPSFNLDHWAMRENTLSGIFHQIFEENDALLIEGVMGLFDGGNASSASLAKFFNIPILLLLDVKGQAETAIAVVRGLANYMPGVDIRGILLNRVGSTRHVEMIRNALGPHDPPIIGAVPMLSKLEIPGRHLGLVQAQEHNDIDLFIEQAVIAIEPHLDINLLLSLFRPIQMPETASLKNQDKALPPLLKVNRLAIAKDKVFSFLYPHLLDSWQKQGTGLSFFSPLANQSPDTSADAIFLPGGYPELHAGQLSACNHFRKGMMAASESGKIIYGECGGYMVMGEAIRDKGGQAHPMLGLLPLISSFAPAKRHLGYREVTVIEPWTDSEMQRWRGHEFHYANIEKEGEGESLFNAFDREGRPLGKIGRRRGRIMGSFFHYIDHHP